MPSGAYVQVNTYEWGMNVFLHGLPEDRDRSSGLCGNFDEDQFNDFTSGLGKIPRDFSDSYRLVVTLSYNCNTLVKVAKMNRNNKLYVLQLAQRKAESGYC